jgi:hypothetical protein
VRQPSGALGAARGKSGECDLRKRVATLGGRRKPNENLNEVVADFTRGNVMVATPLGLEMFDGLFPKVARASQPWALGRNPVGIRERTTAL